jgi:acyl-CoA synthetase (AMP-forming)/AMP-acid ligase II
MEQHEIGLSAFPFFHLAGLMLGLMALSCAATQCLIPDPRDTRLICRMIRKYQPTMLANVPTLYQMLLAEPMFKKLDFRRCKVCISGAAPFSAESIQALESVVGQGKVMEVYGMTETSPLLIMNPYRGKKKIGTVGIPIQNVSVKLVDLETGSKEVPVGREGELIAQGPQVMVGYKDKPAETDYALRDFNGEKWLYTGDVAVMDADGYFKIVDRTKDMVNVGGYKVFSREVEEVLYQHPAVAFCAIVGVPHPDRPGSEQVKAVIQPKGDFNQLDQVALKSDLVQFCQKQMAPYKIPKIIEFVKSIPLTSVGKVDKKALR